MKPWKTLGSATTPDGKSLTFAERDGLYAIRVAGIELMTNRQNDSAEKLAEFGCKNLASIPKARVLVGGLGFGVTLRAVLARARPDAQVVLAELMPEIVEWNRNVDYPLAADALADRRVVVKVGDVFSAIAEEKKSLNSILLDVDNGPAALTMKKNRRLYGPDGLEKIKNALRPQGVLAVWSVEESPTFMKALSRAGFIATAQRANTHAGSGGQRWIFIGQLPKPPGERRT